MKVIFAVFCAIFLTQSSAWGKNIFNDPNEQWACVEEIFRELEVDLERLGEMAGDFVATVTRLMDSRQRCFDILSDPPTALEQRLHEACMIAWRATVLYEVVRMRNIAQGSDAQEIFEQLQRDIFECLDADEDEVINPPARNDFSFKNNV
ncbi:uncharacterized protein LOC129796152 [Lutzomyia longipalpis]|uniref:uncharacterized protein LOC129796152 n=1 Tax=Lutzomyia longipalpis TaxID=7200 RepID=UPI00248356C9|nr:uncharacterized protein LOC129796152 [Lutzomyia longipalpis]